MSDLADLVALGLLPFERRRDLGNQLRAGRSPAAVLAELTARFSSAGSLTIADFRSRAASALARARAASATVVPWTDAAYPPILAAIADPPPVLWLRGRADAIGLPAVAIVGSRAGSSYALSVAERLGRDLAANGLVVVSGLARGVDSAAHRGALAAGGVTVAVLGSGVDVTYPREHGPLAQEIALNGAVLSELAPGTPPLPGFFPARNRIISGLARAVVVVEAGEKSGSLITARCALDQGRDVLAVPGNVLVGRNRGGHALLRDGARIVETADDVLDELGMRASSVPDPSGSREVARHAGGEAADPVLASLPVGEPCDLDEIARRSGWPIPTLLTRLLDLELRGLVCRPGGGRFVRVDTSC
jgi:DNA processing protein